MTDPHDVEPDYGWMPSEADPDRASRWREADEATREEGEDDDDGS